MKRKMHAAGTLYPKKCRACERMFADFNVKLDHALGENRLPDFTPKALLVPHEGYLYSGYTANFAYRMLGEKSAGKKRIVVIAKSDDSEFEGISGSFYKSYKTPCGALKIDIDFLDALRQNCDVTFVKKAHKTSKSEVQMPFIQHYLKELRVVELLYAESSQESLEQLIEFCLADEESVVVVCSDLGDLEAQKELGILDATYLNAIMQLDTEQFKEGCSASGLLALKALVNSSKKMQLKTQILNYQTSSINTQNAVLSQGHVSVAFY